MSQELVQNEEEPAQESGKANVEKVKAPEAPPVEKEPAQEPAPTVEVRGNELPEWALSERKELREEAAKYRTRLREQEEATKAETAKLQAELKEVRLSADRERAAMQAGLPAELTSRLQGETLEEMIADAKLLVGARGGGPRASGAGLNPGDPGRGDVVDPKERARQTWRSQNRVG